MSRAALDALVEPAHLWTPPSDETWGPDAADLAESVGLVLDIEQRLALDCLLARNRGKWAALEAAVIEARQNGKTGGVLLPAALADLFLFGARLVVWSAHKFDTAQEAFREFDLLVSNWSHLSREVKRVWRGNGDESIELRNGSRLKFRARTLTGGRGLSGDRVVLDEAFALEPSHMGALLPTLSARPDPQVMYGSSAGLATSDLLRAVRDRGRAGADPSLAYVEWCAPDGGCADDRCDHSLGVEGCALDEPANWQAANPAMGRRITKDYIAAERRALPAAEFARERLGWWDDPALASESIPADAWNARAGEAAKTERPTFTVDVSLDRSSASIGVAAQRPDGSTQIEVVATGRGTLWLFGPNAMSEGRSVAQSCKEHGVKLVLAGGSPAADLAPDFEAQGVDVEILPRTDVTSACGTMLAAIKEGTVVHLNDPVLNAAVKSARLKAGESYVWTRKGPDDITPLYAVSLARFACVRPSKPIFAY